MFQNPRETAFFVLSPETRWVKRMGNQLRECSVNAFPKREVFFAWTNGSLPRTFLAVHS